MSLDWSTTAWVFPGQGSQFVGMGQALAQTSPAAQATFAEAEAVLGFNLTRLCWEGPEAELTDTVNAQPALLVCAIATLRALREKWEATQTVPQPAFLAGHSLGEISALVVAGALTFEAGVRLVRRRGEVMKAVGERAPGGMAALLNLDAPAVAELCAEASSLTGGVVQVANDNCPGQVVISGESTALEKAMELAKARGAKRAMRLPVSIAAHSPLMHSGMADFTAAVQAVAWQAPQVPVIGNVQVQPLADVAAIQAELPAQLTSPVRWTETIRYLAAQGVTTFIEIGPKDVLTGLSKRIAPQAQHLAVGLPEGLEKLAAL